MIFKFMNKHTLKVKTADSLLCKCTLVEQVDVLPSKNQVLC